jgi:hypothetical protein
MSVIKAHVFVNPNFNSQEKLQFFSTSLRNWHFLQSSGGRDPVADGGRGDASVHSWHTVAALDGSERDDTDLHAVVGQWAARVSVAGVQTDSSGANHAEMVEIRKFMSKRITGRYDVSELTWR